MFKRDASRPDWRKPHHMNTEKAFHNAVDLDLVVFIGDDGVHFNYQGHFIQRYFRAKYMHCIAFFRFCRHFETANYIGT